MDETLKTISDNISFLRKSTRTVSANGKTFRLTQKKLGEMLGVSCQQVSKFELGVNELSALQLFKLAKVFGVSPARFYDNSLRETLFIKQINI